MSSPAYTGTSPGASGRRPSGAHSLLPQAYPLGKEHEPPQRPPTAEAPFTLGHAGTDLVAGPPADLPVHDISPRALGTVVAEDEHQHQCNQCRRYQDYLWEWRLGSQPDHRLIHVLRNRGPVAGYRHRDRQQEQDRAFHASLRLSRPPRHYKAVNRTARNTNFGSLPNTRWPPLCYFRYELKNFCRSYAAVPRSRNSFLI
uniref:Uncharacterized protein n=1 Tax=Solibacter usitatus (strain Ellin6076) TaxID=234267 RepID=Q026A8_SOLUE